MRSARRSVAALGAIVLALLPGGVARSVAARSGGCQASVVFEGTHFIVCSYRPGTHELRLAWAGPSGPLGGLDALRQSLGAEAARVRFAMNAGMYDPGLRPLGLFVALGQVVQPLNTQAGQGNFYLAPNGVFWVGADGRAHVDETRAFERGAFAGHAGARPQWATQSGPLLVEAGRIHPAFTADGPSRLIRNGVGVRNGEAAFVISAEPVSFGRFARLMRDRLGMANALYLDGSVSSLWSPELHRLDPRTGLGPLVLVLDRPSRK